MYKIKKLRFLLIRNHKNICIHLTVLSYVNDILKPTFTQLLRKLQLHTKNLRHYRTT